MTATTEPPPRIATLDIVRGVAVMGILAMNIVDFAMPPQAYVNPLAYGVEGTADWVSWIFSFIFVDGKMRGLFSFLFGASLLLVIDRAEAKGEAGGAVHFRRMFWLAVFGLLHFYLIWHGDILFGYAVAGMAAFLFRRLEPKTLVRLGILFVLFQFLLFAMIAAGLLSASASADPAALKEWAELTDEFGVPGAAELQKSLTLFGGGYGGIVAHRLKEQTVEPFLGLLLFSWETIGYMLFGMAGLKSGFLRGEWAVRSYLRTAILCFGVGIPIYAAIAWAMFRTDFAAPTQFALWGPATVLVRPVTVLGTAALIILLARRGGELVERIAAAGRAAFTNYLGTSILMTSLFFGYGGGLYGRLSRVELWLVVLPMWGLMLLWSKPWLDRHLYGPFEWLWRSLARGSPQPMRKARPALAG